jgi:glutamine synthetase
MGNKPATDHDEETTKDAVLTSIRTLMHPKVDYSKYGTHLFKGHTAAPYLRRYGLSPSVLDGHEWVTNGNIDKVAAAILDWCRDNDASLYCHWFQPLGASGLRHGQSAQVQQSMFEFDKQGTLNWVFEGKQLLKGETDGSSFPNGGLRVTHSAAAYLSIDPTSPVFLRGDTIFIPACMVSYYGHALDEKTPLLRSLDALSKQGSRLLNLLKFKTHVKSVYVNIGLEQELFFIQREPYLKRPDLQLTGRTILGRMPPRGQELSDHYMAPPSLASAAIKCMQEIQQQCFLLGIPLRTRHREVAPNQYEFAPLYGTVTTQIDQNLVVMQIIEEVAVKHGLAALLQEKPFQGVNGSGKHNNWSLATDNGTNLLNVNQLAENSGSPDIFPVVMAAIVQAVDQYGDLMRMSIASPGNDFRLGACEAPPSIISAYLGEDMTSFLEAYKNGENKPYKPRSRTLNLGASVLAPMQCPAEDRNRTSPFPYGGHRFEFRAVGSSQNVSMVNTVLATMCAKVFKEFSDLIEAGTPAKKVAQDALSKHWKVIFNGNGYDPVNQQALTDKGLWRFDSGVDAICRLTEAKNVSLFQEMNVLTPEECTARRNVMLNQYIGTVEMEAQCMIDMLNQHIIPSVKAAGVGPLSGLGAAVETLKKALADIHHTGDNIEKAHKCRKLRVETMIDIRKVCDDAEAVVPASLWTLATYKELLFMDSNTV